MVTSVGIEVFAETDKAVKDIDKVNKSLDKTTKKTKQADKATKKLTKDLTSGFRTAGATVAAFQGPLGGISSRIAAVGTIVRNVTGNLKSFGGIAGLAAVAVTAFGGASFLAAKKADEFELSLRRLDVVLKQTGGAAGFSSEQIERFSQDLARNTLASVEGVLNASRVLATFNKVSGDTFKDALELSQDLAETGFGNLQGAAVGLGKALQDPITGLTLLSRQGTLTKNQQKEIGDEFKRTGDLAKAQGDILEAIRSQVGGVGAASGATLTGALDSLGQSFLNLVVNIGNAANEAGVFTRAINSMSGALQDLANDIGEIGDLSDKEIERRLAKATETLAASTEKLATVRGNARRGVANSIRTNRELVTILTTESERRIKVSEAAAQEAVERQKVLKIQDEELKKAAKLKKAQKELLKTRERLREPLREVRRLGLSVEDAAIDEIKEVEEERLKIVAESIKAELLLQGEAERLRADIRLNSEKEIQEALQEIREDLAEDQIDEEGFLVGFNDSIGLAIDQTKDLEDQVRQLDEQIQTSFGETIGEAFNQVSDGIANAIVEGESLEDTFDNIAKTIASDLISSMIRFGIQRAILAATGDSEARSTAANLVATNAEITASAVPAATAEAGATFGASAAAGLAAILALFAATQGFRQSGGEVSGGGIFRVNEGGAPETFSTRDGREFLLAPPSGGKVNKLSQDPSGANQRIVINNNAPGAEVSMTRNDDEVIEIAVQRSVVAAQQAFENDLATGYGGYSRSLTRNMNVRRSF